MKIFNAVDIPHFYEQNPEGVANTEYDCDLTNTSACFAVLRAFEISLCQWDFSL